MGSTAKPQLLLVHGIGGVRDADEERREWKRALAEGARAAGCERHISALTADWLADSRFADYSDLFRRRGAQGESPEPDALDDEAALITLALAVAYVDELDGSAGHDGDLRRIRAQASLYLERDAAERKSQGLMSPARQAAAVCAALARVPGVQLGLQRVSAARCLSILSQPGRYLRRKERLTGDDGRVTTLDERIRERVASELDPDRPLVVIGHSLGSVVALETLAAYPGRAELFVTIGAPIAMNAFIWPRLRPQPPAVPDRVTEWLDAWDGDDPVVPLRRLSELIAPNAAGVLPRPLPLSSRAAWTHSALTYLRRPEVAGPVMRTLVRLGEAGS
ncbi:alpha/beta fold hydrolase [Streptomyces sp. NPDC047085]|uniref:alpha/beta fold hydrolase n=1 Tax=Streptomyces sp. NPDC047085 TaxID=3155140 RepID=UPI0033F0573F